MTINDFRGQVKISDIQSAFDEIVNRINSCIDIYNQAGGFSDIDYTKGSPKLSSAGYTLSVGGLKKILEVYNNTLFGCKAYKIDNLNILVSDGLYIKDNNIYRINSRVVSGEEGWDLSSLYYDIDNDSVMFRNGSAGDVVDVSTTWTQPSINSNVSCGIFTANSNSENAYKSTTSEGYKFQLGQFSQVYGSTITGEGGLTWQLPKAIKLSQLTLDASVFPFGAGAAYGTVKIFLDDELIYTGNGGSLSFSFQDRATSSIKIICDYGYCFGIQMVVKNLHITGTASTIAIETGGVITPSDNIIKLCDLNWASDDILLNSIDGIQLEGLDNVSITSQDRRVNKLGMGWENLDNTNSSKFVAYTSQLYNGNGSCGGINSFLGVELNGGYADGGTGRNHWTCTALSLIYIPKGFNVVDTRSGNSGRFVFDATLNK